MKQHCHIKFEERHQPIIQRAADLTGLSVLHFVKSTAIARAKQVLAEESKQKGTDEPASVL